MESKQAYVIKKTSKVTTNKFIPMIRKNNYLWTEKAKSLAKELHNEIGLDHYNWHKFRGNKKRRSAELIVSAISQLINDGDDKEIETLLKQSILWLKEEIKDSGCKSH